MSSTFSCPLCGRPTIEVSLPFTYRRGDRALTVQRQFWRCPGDCLDFDSEEIFTFSTLDMMRADEAKAKEEWLTRFGEPMPPGRGRHP